MEYHLLLKKSIEIGITYLVILITFYTVYAILFFTTHEIGFYLTLFSILFIYSIVLVGVIILVAYDRYSSENRVLYLVNAMSEAVDKEMFCKGKIFDLNLECESAHERSKQDS